MKDENPSFTIRASSSRLQKGLLAIPRKFESLFPKQKSQIEVYFDDGASSKSLTFIPYDRKSKETRIFGLGGWFAKRKIVAGDTIRITFEDQEKTVYRIALERYVKERRQKKSRKRLFTAKTEEAAKKELVVLGKLSNRRPAHVAQEELNTMAREPLDQPRPKVKKSASPRYEGVPAVTRILLREIHQGKCQLCSFTFEKQDGDPYFEIHHLDPKIGHHPCNLLLLCANCHAQFEHACVAGFEWSENWLVGVEINGKRQSLHQPLAPKRATKSVFGIGVLFLIAQMSHILPRVIH